MMIPRLIETTWMVRYPWTVDITYDQWGEFLVHEFKNSLLENEYGIKTTPDYPGNPHVISTIERMHQVLVNIVRTYNLQEKYVDDACPWMGILAASDFYVQYRYYGTKGKSTVQLVFGRGTILPINHIADWRYICQCKQAQTENM